MSRFSPSSSSSSPKSNGYAKRRIAGQEMAGTVEAVGANVTALKPGDEVYGQLPGGAFAEYVCAPAGLFAPKPANLTFEEAAAVPGCCSLDGRCRTLLA
ncbi:alcohol dehydrogenase catalytic domain-containing protein [Archangium sp.]|uniref:alcohol dehydrogenase catalytic domain-containing protein n=1 Tax=Archangium sp. TaxID=1872627 RepID=UPI00286B76F7|nr:alcohol dehydrogenase catalytic domain-containing protein [Archangium sp.]